MKFDLRIIDLVTREEETYGEGLFDYEWQEFHEYDYPLAKIVDEGYYDVALCPNEADVKPGEDIYVVYVSYDTGDSFGREYNRRIYLWAFSDYERAQRLTTALTKDGEENPDYDFDHKPMMFEDVPIATNDWKGHFENFNFAGIELVRVE